MPVHIVKNNYEHFNTSMPNWNTPKGVYVKNKDHYDRLMKENGMITEDEMKRRAAAGPKLKEYVLSEESKAIIKAAKACKDSNGKVKLSGRTIEALHKKGIIGGRVVPKSFQLPK